METDQKAAWIDAENKVVSFHPTGEGTMVTRSEDQFWDYIIGLTKTGYRIM